MQKVYKLIVLCISLLMAVQAPLQATATNKSSVPAAASPAFTGGVDTFARFLGFSGFALLSIGIYYSLYPKNAPAKISEVNASIKNNVSSIVERIKKTTLVQKFALAMAKK